MVIRDIDKATDIILKELLKHGFDEHVFGLRKDSSEYAVGDTPRKSNHWYDFDWDNAEPLDGTCATHIDLMLCIEDDIDEMRAIIKNAICINRDYMGENWYLLWSDNYNYDEGQDEDEIIMKDVKVLLKIEL